MLRFSQIARLSLAVSTAMICYPAMAQTADNERQTGGDAPVPQQAQQAADDTTNDIIVTAQKRSERLSDVPLSINAATGDTLRSRGVTSTADLEKIVPGFTYSKSAYGSPILTIRGIGFYDDAIAIAPTVSVYSDQVPVPFSRMAEGVALDLERVEVLKGPQGTLFGQNSTGGAINYIPAKPTRDFHTGVDVSYGSFNAVNAQGYISGPIAPGLTARLSGLYERSDDWQKSVTSNRTLGARRFGAARLLLDYEASDALKFELNVNGWRDRSDAQALQYVKYSPNTPTPAEGNNPAYTGFEGSPLQPTLDRDLHNYPFRPGDRWADWDPDRNFKRNDSYYQIALRGDWRVSDRITLSTITGYNHLRVLSPSELDGTRFLDAYAVSDGQIDSFTQEVRLSGTAGGNDELKFMVGGNYQHDTTKDAQILTFDGTNTGLFAGTPLEVRYSGSGITNRHDEKIETKAVFGSVDYKITSSLTAQASVRYTKDVRHFSGCLADQGDGVFARGFGTLANVLHGVFAAPQPGDRAYIANGACATLVGDPNSPDFNYPIKGPLQATLPENNVSWRLGLSWKVTPETMLYGNVTRGYKSGSFGTLPYLTDTQIQPIKQEQVTAYEIGFKSSLFNHKLDLTGAAFYYDYVNKQLLGYFYTGAVFGNLPGEVSIPKSRVLGAEGNAVARPMRGLTLSAGATYINSKITGDFRTVSPDALYSFQASNDPSCPPGSTIGGCGVNIKGSPFIFTPKWNLIGDAQYSFRAFDGWDLVFGGSVSWRTSTSAAFAAPPNGTPANQSKTTAADYLLPTYALLDLRMGLESGDGRYRVQIWGRNVTNRYYWSNALRYQDTLGRITGKPATYGLTLSAKY